MTINITRIQNQYTTNATDGCLVNPSCLSCPLEVCVFEDVSGVAASTKKALITLYSVDELVVRFGVRRRTVQEWAK